MEPLLKITDLSISFTMAHAYRDRVPEPVVKHFNLCVYEGEVLAIVGASGGGKSLLAAAISGVLPLNARCKGEIRFKGRLLTEEYHKKIRGNAIALVPQSVNYLDPLLKIGKQMFMPYEFGYDNFKKRKERHKLQSAILSLFKQFDLGSEVLEMYPHQLSGGMARRVLVVMALLKEPELLLADEPTPGMSLEQSLQALAFLRALANKGRGVLLITHDLELALEFADKLVIVKDGEIVESCDSVDFKNGKLRHAYSMALWSALPQNGFNISA